MTFSKRPTTVKSRLSSSRLSSGVMTSPNSSTCMVLSLFPCTHFFCLTIWASRRQSCLAWGAYSWRNRHPSSLALSLLLDHTRQFHEWNCPWNCFRENVLIASRYSNDCFMMHYWCKLDFCNLQQGGKKNRTNQRWITLASMSCFCAVLLCTMCSHMCLPSFAAWENNTTLVWELALCTERVSERSQTFDACMEICPSDSWENFQSNFYKRRLFNKMRGEVAKKSETPFLEKLQERQSGIFTFCLLCLFPSPVCLV